MSIIRSLNSFSLPELFQLIEKDAKSGRLIVETPVSHHNNQREGIYYVWFKNGYLIAISNCINQKGLINLIDKRGWISPPIVSRLRRLCPAGVPLGVYLRKMKLLNSEKISLIFQLQLHQMYRLFQLERGRFRFDDFAELKDRILTIPWLEMTGHQIKTSEVSMYALRLMENSENFVGQLPALGQALKRKIAQPHLKLISVERQLWEMADGKTSLIGMVKKTNYSTTTVQNAAFRLIAVGLVEAIFLPSHDGQTKNYLPEPSAENEQPQEADLANETSLLETLGDLFKRNV